MPSCARRVISSHISSSSLLTILGGGIPMAIILAACLNATHAGLAYKMAQSSFLPLMILVPLLLILLTPLLILVSLPLILLSPPLIFGKAAADSAITAADFGNAAVDSGTTAAGSGAR